ncbi:MAG: DUF6231 family protein [Pseudomonadales bacterium]
MVVPSPLQALAHIVSDRAPASMLVCSREPVPGLVEYTSSTECQTSIINVGNTLAELETLGRYELAIVADQLEHLPKTAGLELLGRIRNLHSNHICVLYAAAGKSAAWTAVDFFGMGLKLAQRFEKPTQASANKTCELQLYTYAVESYNHQRSWNNNRYWANPENFGKYWW